MATEWKHSWTEGDDLVALYLSRHGARTLPLTQAGIAQVLGMSEASLIMHQRNFQHLEGGRRLSHAAAQSGRILERYKRAAEAELRPMVVRLLERKQ